MDKEFLNLVTERGIRSLQLDKVDRFQLEDAGLQEELNRALAAVAGARDQDKKPVDIRFNGTGERRVRLGYVVETPIWKASYRLVLAGDDPGDRKPKATLQGWAIVENQTDNDWNNVRLSLVSGRPISFTENLVPAALRAAPGGDAGTLRVAASADVSRVARLRRAKGPDCGRFRPPAADGPAGRWLEPGTNALEKSAKAFPSAPGTGRLRHAPMPSTQLLVGHGACRNPVLPCGRRRR